MTCYGDGSPLRYSLYVDDLANLCVFLILEYDAPQRYGIPRKLLIVSKAMPPVEPTIPRCLRLSNQLPPTNKIYFYREVALATLIPLR